MPPGPCNSFVQKRYSHLVLRVGIEAAISFLKLFETFVINGTLPDAVLMATVALLFRGNFHPLTNRHVLPMLGRSIWEQGLQNTWEAAVCIHLFLHWFHFDQDEIKCIAVSLYFFPTIITTAEERGSVFLVESLCLLFHRFAFRCCHQDFGNMFGQPSPTLGQNYFNSHTQMNAPLMLLVTAARMNKYATCKTKPQNGLGASCPFWKNSWPSVLLQSKHLLRTTKYQPSISLPVRKWVNISRCPSAYFKIIVQ